MWQLKPNGKIWAIYYNGKAIMQSRKLRLISKHYNKILQREAKSEQVKVESKEIKTKK